MKVRDISEYLAQVGLVEPARKLQARVTYQDPCHLAHAQGVRSAPRQLLKFIGAEVVESPRPDSCCGSAGVYNVVQNEISMKILDEKMEYIASVEPQIVATANVGCMLQLSAGAKRKGLHSRVVHVVELLDEALLKIRFLAAQRASVRTHSGWHDETIGSKSKPRRGETSLSPARTEAVTLITACQLSAELDG